MYFLTILKTLKVTNKTIIKQNNTAPITSDKKYWYNDKFRPLDFNCGAPLCRMTYSVQYTTFFSGDIGWSLNTFEAILAFSAYLKQSDYYDRSTLENIVYPCNIYFSSLTSDTTFFRNASLEIDNISMEIAMPAFTKLSMFLY